MADATSGRDGATVGTDRNGRVLTIVGFVLAGLGLFFLPIVSAPSARCWAALMSASTSG